MITEPMPTPLAPFPFRGDKQEAELLLDLPKTNGWCKINHQMPTTEG